MPRAAATIEKKQGYMDRVSSMVEKYQRILIFGADMVTSRQMQKIRIALRGNGELLMGKNTMMRKAIRSKEAANPALKSLGPLVKTNVGLVFTNEDAQKIRELINNNRSLAPARAGVIAPNDVVVPKQQTALEPTQTSFFQALNIATKINKGAIEILNDVNLIAKGDKVGASEAALLNKLNIKPFSFGLELLQVWDQGSVFTPAVLDLTEADLIKSFQAGVARIAAIGLQVGFPTIASVPHSIAHSFKRLLAVAVEAEYEIPQSKAILEFLKNPDAFKAAAPAPVAVAEAPKVEPKKKKETSSDGDMGMGLFD
jgi:large subunit ribosomal protein LP0